MFEGKKILVIGGTGTIGQAVIRGLLPYKPSVVRIFSRDEYKQFLMQDSMKGCNNIRFLLGDVRDKERLEMAMKDIDLVFDFAALKHVPACEYNPFEAVKTNVIGTQNVIQCAIEAGVRKVIYASSDKAVSPTNTMGATKLLAERLISAADYSKGPRQTVFAAVRFGNVLGSRGSVIQLWQRQALEDMKITVTDPEMTRFVLTLERAVGLTFKACELARGGEIFVLKMPVVRLGDLAEVFTSEICPNNAPAGKIEIELTGLRPGEKMYEEMMTRDEAAYAVEFDDMFAIQPLTRAGNARQQEASSYISSGEKLMSKDQIQALVRKALNKGDSYD